MDSHKPFGTGWLYISYRMVGRPWIGLCVTSIIQVTPIYCSLDLSSNLRSLFLSPQWQDKATLLRRKAMDYLCNSHSLPHSHFFKWQLWIFIASTAMESICALNDYWWHHHSVRREMQHWNFRMQRLCPFCWDLYLKPYTEVNKCAVCVIYVHGLFVCAHFSRA